MTGVSQTFRRGRIVALVRRLDELAEEIDQYDKNRATSLYPEGFRRATEKIVEEFGITPEERKRENPPS
jgi:predicted nuclease with TOPRIM domain